MLDIKLIRDDINAVREKLAGKNVKIDLSEVAEKDKILRALQSELDNLRNIQNKSNDEISKLIKEKKDAKEKISLMKAISTEIDSLEPKIKGLQEEISKILLFIPNVPHSSVPVGTPANNKVVRSWGEIKNLGFKPKTHIEIAEDLDIIDFKRASKLSGSHFILYKKKGALLERALYCFMLDYHTNHHGYTEIFPPFLVNRESMTGTGQLPKMEEDMYRLEADDLFLIPTAEVPITNIHRDEVLSEEALPIYYTGYTACFRREAGSYGKDTRGLVRVHQFNKVEMVKFVKPETSYDELEKLVANAEKICQLLEIPYRVVMLATGDLSFAASKCYDLEAHAAGVDKWLEISSCSNFEDFQARRANIRFKGITAKKPAFVHTLNGSGLALARTMIAILENNQTPEGEVVIPKVLRPYMGNAEKITK
ncbi:MAG: serine--tRNA ligase [Candidatus Omnitrophica bacterium]|nr:serine--tRNA ligase [Candidatus Omnitrophota bacterium]